MWPGGDAVPDEDERPPSVESIARCVLVMLLKKWILIHLKYFTVAFRRAKSTTESCNLQVLAYTNKLERISAKRLGSNMKAFGHFVQGDWDKTVRKKIGLELPPAGNNDIEKKVERNT
jgi:hypothetical protein